LHSHNDGAEQCYIDNLRSVNLISYSTTQQPVTW